MQPIRPAGMRTGALALARPSIFNVRELVCARLLAAVQFMMFAFVFEVGHKYVVYVYDSAYVCVCSLGVQHNTNEPPSLPSHNIFREKRSLARRLAANMHSHVLTNADTLLNRVR